MPPISIFYCETSDDGTVGGSHTCMYNLVRHSDRDRFRFTVGFFSENHYAPKYRDLGVEVEIMPAIPAKRTGLSVTRKAVNWYNREYRLEKYLHSYMKPRRFDILLLNNTIFESVSFINVGYRLKLPIIAYERGIMEYSQEHVRASRRVDGSIAVSDAIFRNMVRHGFKSKTMEMIYDGIDPDSFEGPFDPLRVKNGLGIPVESKIIGIIGNVRSWKGQKYFIEAFRILLRDYEDLYGLIIGGWSEMDLEYLGELQRSVRDAGLEERVRFLGYRKDTPALLSVLDVFVHASIRPEPFGMVLLEAMAARVPVIATRFGGPIEILNGGTCGALVPSEDAGSIAEACGRYLTDRPHRELVVENAYRRLREQFHIRNTVGQVGKLLETVRGNHATGE